jgi:hypothetical protein
MLCCERLQAIKEAKSTSSAQVIYTKLSVASTFAVKMPAQIGKIGE